MLAQSKTMVMCDGLQGVLNKAVGCCIGGKQAVLSHSSGAFCFGILVVMVSKLRCISTMEAKQASMQMS